MTRTATLANVLRKKYKLHTIPIDTIKICKKNKLSVVRYDFCDIEESVGCQILSMIDYDKHKSNGTIYINVNTSEMAQRFYVAHELGHYFLHLDDSDDGTIFSFQGLKTNRETEAREFAIELLLPKEQLRKEYDEALFPSLSFLAGVFEVPASTMKSRLEEMGLEYIC